MRRQGVRGVELRRPRGVLAVTSEPHTPEVTTPSRPTAVHVTAEDVLAVVRGLVRELRGEAISGRVSLESSLERDLGISSLERAELIGRLERQLGGVAEGASVATAETVGTLARAFVDRVPSAREPRRRFDAVPTDLQAAPVACATLVDVLAWHAARHPDRVHVVVRDEDTDDSITYGALWAEARRLAAGIRVLGLEPRDTVGIMLRTERAFFSTFFGVLLAGCIPVPMYPPFRADRLADYAERQVAILESCGARLLITFDQVERVASLLRAQLSESVRVTTPQGVLDRSVEHIPDTAPDAGAGALIQYTSGSTGDPKGVYLTHANLLANIRAVGERLELTSGDRLVSWLPLYHDMGLIGSWLGSMYFGLPALIMSPLFFLSRPVRWLQALHEFGGTISPGPNFAYDLCVRRVDDADLVGVDLRHVRLLLNGSEAVLPETLQRFTSRFAAFGIRRSVLVPVYGLAECAVGLSAPRPGRDVIVDRIDRDTLQRAGRAVPSGEAGSQAFVSCGVALPGHELRIVDDEDRPVPERVQGHVQFRGPSVMAGYYRRPDATAVVRTSDGWTRAGDLGYTVNGEVFITGRSKDLIIRGGRNMYPQELEDVTSSVPGVRSGCVAAFGVTDETTGTERVVIVAETRARDEVERDQIRQRISTAIAAAVGGPPDDVHLVGPGRVLKTSSGKIRRAATRRALLSGDLSARMPGAGGQVARVTLGALAGELRRAWHTGAAVAHTAYLACLLVLLLPPLGLALVVAPTPARARAVLRGWCRLLVALSWCRLRVVGGLDAGASMVLAANHGSYLDPVWLLAGVARDCRFAAKAGLAAYPGLGLVIRRCGFLPIEKRDHEERLASAGVLESALAEGGALVVFPEGTFVRAPGLLPFRLGAFRAAVSRGIGVVPIGIAGARRVLADGAWLVRPGIVTLTIGQPAVPTSDTWSEALRIRDVVKAEIVRASGEADLERDVETELYSAI